MIKDMQKKVLKRLKELRFQYVKRYYIFVPLTMMVILLAVSSIVMLFGRQAKAATTLTDSLVSFWNLNEESGTRADSVVASANDLSEVSPPVGFGTGRVGNSVTTVSATTKYLRKATNASLQNGGGDFSVSAWVKFDAIENSKYIVSKYREWSLFYVANNFYFRTYNTLVPSQYDVIYGFSPVVGTWYHLVAVHDATAGTNMIYLNNGAVHTTSSVAAPNLTSPGDFQIGALNGTGILNGSVDSVGYWNRKLTVAEVTELYGAGSGNEYPFEIIAPTVTTGTASSITDTSAWLPGNIDSLGGEPATVRGIEYGETVAYGATASQSGSFSIGAYGQMITGLTCNTLYHYRTYATNSAGTGNGADQTFTTGACGGSSTLTDGILSFWKMEENNATRIDSLGSNNLAESGGSSPNASGIVNYGADFNSAKFLTINDNVTLETGNTSFSVSAWVKLNNLGNNQILASKYKEWALFYTGSFFYFVTYTNANSTAYYAISTTVPTVDTWYHIVGVHDFATNQNRIYVNGVLEREVAATLETELSNASPFQAGAMNGAFTFINATVDALGFWKKVLTLNEAQELYKTGYGIEYPFTTAGIIAPTITIQAVTDITSNSVTANATITSTGGENPIAKFQYSTDLSYSDEVIVGSQSLGAFSGSLTGLRCNTLYNIRAVATNSAGSANAVTTFTTGACSNTITITSPVDYQVIQRIGANGDIPVTGNYTIEDGASDVIEGYWNGNPTITLTTTPAWSNGGTFSGTLTSQPQGQGTLTVKFSTHAENDTVIYLGIGDIYVIAGQSNAMGYGLTNQIYTPPLGNPTLKASMFGNDDVWKELVDPVDSDINQVDLISSDPQAAGSIWPLVATLFMADQNVPIAFIPTAKGGAEIGNWLPNLGDPGNPSILFGSMYRRITAAGNIKAVLFWEGETDAVNGVSQASFNSSLDLIANTINSYFGVKLNIGQIGDVCTIANCLDEPNTGLDNIRLAQLQAWGDNANVSIGPSLYDVLITDEGSDGVHFRSDNDMQIAANRWWAALQESYYGGTSGRGPILLLAEYNAPKTEITVIFNTDSQLLPAAGIEGFTVKDDGVTTAISSVDRVADNKVKITLVAPATGVITVSYAESRTANLDNITNVLTDSSAYNLPAEVFVDYVADPADTNPPTFTIVQGVEAGPVSSDVINVTVSDLEGNLDASTIEYGFSSDVTCDAGDTYGNSFTSGVDFTITTAHIDYLCVTASDWSVNIGYQLVGKLNIPASTPIGGQIPDYDHPGDVTNLVVKADSTGKITLTWQDPTDTDLREIVITETLSNLTANTYIIAKGVETAIFTNRIVGSEYDYLIKARDASGLESAGVFSKITVPKEGEVSGNGEEPMEEGAGIILPAGVAVGDLIKVAGTTTVYFIDADKRRHTFPNEPTFFSYFTSFDGIKTVPLSALAQIAIGKNVTVRPGTWLVKIQTDPKVYAVEPYGVLRYISTVDIAEKLYGTNWATRIIDVSPAFFVDYQPGDPITTLAHPTEAVLKYQNSANLYFIDQGKKRLIPSAVFVNNKFQNIFILTNFDQTLNYPDGEVLGNQKIEEIITIR